MPELWLAGYYFRKSTARGIASASLPPWPGAKEKPSWTSDIPPTPSETCRCFPANAGEGGSMRRLGGHHVESRCVAFHCSCVHDPVCRYPGFRRPDPPREQRQGHGGRLFYEHVVPESARRNELWSHRRRRSRRHQLSVREVA